ncbi:MAG: hypothetical protein JST82_02790 [Bacteroidetes bacterium]|nr:hypothetical protein [Bacteroidota bacterium]
MRIPYIIIALLFTMLLSNRSIAQQSDSVSKTTIITTDTAAVSRDSIKPVRKHKFEPKPKKAGLYSAIIPGTGQIYNRNYWKVPLIAGGTIAAVYIFDFNREKYNYYRKVYLNRISNPNAVDNEPYDTPTLKQLQDEYRKYMDMTVLFSALGYTAQVIDAIVSAHLKNFDISRDISIKFKPVMMPNYIGAGIVLALK